MDLLEQHLAHIPNPCYVMEEQRLRRNLSLIRDVAQRAGVEIILAFKAFALWKSFGIFREYIDHTTASSPYEARLALEEFGSKAHTYSPAYEPETFDDIVRCSSHVTFNSLSQYRRFAQQVAQHPEVEWGLRVNPEYSEIETELYNPCAAGSRFGILAADMPESLPAGVSGFHVHCHCESGADAFERTLVHIEERFARWFPQLRWMNFGGGHLMTRADYDVERLVRVLTDFRSRYPWLRVILEPGSAFAWQTGPLLSRVVDIVENKGIRTAILNVSFTCHMPDCLEMPYMPAVRHARIVDDAVLTTAAPAPRHLYRLGGNSCLSGDFLGLWQFDHELAVGDPVIFEDMIHYTTVKTTMFNGVHHPSVGLLHADGTFELYRQYRYEDYRDRMC
ncbi:MAG: carboxynorspermidine decarboxylase [Prevotellaceae bacterium]|nr:carboxynorspermidine decarboxylase [Prevotellaceae bacterium]